MPRRPRIYLGGMPLNIVQRGHNREACFSVMMIILLIAIGSAVRAIHQQNSPLYRHTMGQPLQVLIGACSAYLLLCQRYIELNPVRAAMVADPADYRWSSYRSGARPG